jgi:hypothetical protein
VDGFIVGGAAAAIVLHHWQCHSGTSPALPGHAMNSAIVPGGKARADCLLGVVKAIVPSKAHLWCVLCVRAGSLRQRVQVFELYLLLAPSIG